MTGAGALEILRRCRRSAGDLRKVFLALYGLLLWVPAALLVLALGRASLGGSLGEEAAASFLRPVQAALGFLRDGFAAGAWRLLGGFYSAPGFCDEYLTAFLATDLAPEHADGDEDEDISVEALTLDETLARVDAGEIVDAKSLATLMLYLRQR